MREKRMKPYKLIAVICTILLVGVQTLFLFPQTALGASGQSLEVRVQYFGERGDKLRTKTTFYRSDLEAMGAGTYHYSNVTNVGTVMVMKARGPKVTTILDEAGIDVGSVQNVTFRTTDGYTRNFTGAQITALRNYYPKLNLYTKIPKAPEEPDQPEKPDQPDKPDGPEEPATEPVTEPEKEPVTEPEATEGRDSAGFDMRSLFVEEVYGASEYDIVLNYIRSDDGRSLTPREGSLAGADHGVPAILALEFNSTKEPGIRAESLSMKTRQTFRFCLGQSALKEGKKTSPGYGGGDVSSMDSAHSIYGMDVTLYGSPVKSVELSLKDPDTKVGAKVRVDAKIIGDSLFSEYLDTSTLKWESSDTSIATVDSNGIVTIKKEGEVVITATAKDGTKGTITIGGPEGKESAAGKDGKEDKDEDKDKDKDKDAESKTGLVVREISIGDEVIENEAQMAGSAATTDTEALDEGEAYGREAAMGAAAVALLACGGGAVIRIRKYRLSL